jgi:hypothetical protein
MYKININIVNKENKYQVRSTCLRDPSFNGEGDYAPPSPSDYFFLDLIKKSVIVLQVLPKFLTENCNVKLFFSLLNLGLAEDFSSKKKHSPLP